MGWEPVWHRQPARWPPGIRHGATARDAYDATAWSSARVSRRSGDSARRTFGRPGRSSPVRAAAFGIRPTRVILPGACAFLNRLGGCALSRARQDVGQTTPHPRSSPSLPRPEAPIGQAPPVSFLLSAYPGALCRDEIAWPRWPGQHRPGFGPGSAGPRPATPDPDHGLNGARGVAGPIAGFRQPFPVPYLQR